MAWVLWLCGQDRCWFPHVAGCGIAEKGKPAADLLHLDWPGSLTLRPSQRESCLWSYRAKVLDANFGSSSQKGGIFLAL